MKLLNLVVAAAISLMPVATPSCAIAAVAAKVSGRQVIDATLPGFRAVQLFPGERLMRLEDAEGRIEYVSIDSKITPDLLLRALPDAKRLEMAKGVAVLESDPYPCDLSPCQAGRITWNPATNSWGPGMAVSSGEYYDNNGPISGGDGLTLTEADMIRWLNWHQGVCESIPGVFGLEGQYVALLAASVVACAASETGGGAILCGAAISATAAMGITLDQARSDCNSSYSYGAGG